MGLSPGRTAAVLAIDAGNSKTDAALVAADGTVLGQGRSGGFRPPAAGVAAAVDVLAEAVAGAVRQAGAADFGGTGVRGGPVAAHVSACLANVDLPVEERALLAALRARGWGRTVAVHNDTFALLRAGLPPGAQPRGVAVVCGAGINCAGLLPDGRTHRFLALGKLSGDWGGGAGLAAEAIWYAARAEDGRGEPTALATEVPAQFGLGTMAELIEGVHLGTVPVARTQRLAPLLFAVAAGGDPVARSIVDRQADEVVALAAVALERLDLLDEEVPVVLGGSVLAAGHAQLDDRIRMLLTARAPKAVPRVVTAAPVLGAALLGLDRAGAPEEAKSRTRAFYD
ncbi:ATPase [Streptomyces sp. WMMC500]|uniref:N-acetylglucosamine kinase n=1 Tax=Streptomyces sp. WMMC500 TaxID=3015154 RepID=UPI00248B22E3|nr:BadF/BadG/BcrA/BcrD ATPase family protein [Streptomyces sp. WMMC500]WBB59292.1 ATPase [Streptomyces sp. WMMC500]